MTMVEPLIDALKVVIAGASNRTQLALRPVVCRLRRSVFRF